MGRPAIASALSRRSLSTTDVVVAGVGQANDLRIGPGHRRLGDGAPGVPRPLLAQLVEQHQIAGQATTAAPVRGLDLVALSRRPAAAPSCRWRRSPPARSPRAVRAGPRPSPPPAVPHLLGDVQVLRGAEHQRHAFDVHPPQRQVLAAQSTCRSGGRPAPATCGTGTNRPSGQFQRVLEQPPLPRQQLQPKDLFGEPDRLEASRGFWRQIHQRGREYEWSFATVERLKRRRREHYATPRVCPSVLPRRSTADAPSGSAQGGRSCPRSAGRAP